MKSQSIKDPLHKLWIILERTAKIRTCHCTCIVGVGKACTHVPAAVQTGLTNPTCTSNANNSLPNQKTIEPKKIKALDFSGEDFGQRGKKIISSFTKKTQISFTEKL